MITKQVLNFILFAGMTALSAVVMVGCLTPMASNEIEPLTECNHGDLAQVKRNLILAGYGIAHAATGEIITDFRQLSSNQNWQRISAVKMSPNKIKLVFRQRQSFNHPIALTHSRSLSGINQNPENNFASTMHYQSSINEFDPIFYSEHKNHYIQQHSRICNVTPSQKRN